MKQSGMRVGIILLSTSLFVIISSGLFAQKYMSMKPKKPIICYAKDIDEHTVVEANEKYLKWKRNPSARIKTATFEVTYNGFSAEAKASFQQAVDIWETLITSPVTIRVNATWQPLGAGILGSAIWGSVHANFDGAQRINTWYPAALAEKMAGHELNAANEFDIQANFSSSFNWYYGLTGTPPTGKYDLVTVVLHELGHGLGFVDSYFVQNGFGFVGANGTNVPMIYDQYLETSNGINLYHDYTTGTTNLGAELTSNGVYFNSPQVLAANTDRGRIYAPTNYDGGSSISHLNESTYSTSFGAPNSLMTPQIAAVETIHDPGPIVLAAFSDMGWVFTHIKHTDLKDTENEDGPFVIKATITSESGPVNQPQLHYTTGGADVTLDMTTTGNPNEYQATIPATGNATTYAYYISVRDGLDREFTRPGKLITPRKTIIDQAYTTFTAGPDTESPRITHSPKAFVLNTETQLEVKAFISDNLGIAEAKIEYFVNDVAKSSIMMTAGIPDSLYSAMINISGLSIGDEIKYRIVAIDNSAAENLATNPETEYHIVNVTGLAPTQDFYVNNFNTPSDDFFGEGFSIATPSAFTNPALHSTHPYSEGNGFPNDELNLIYQLRVPIRVKNADATIRFDEIVLVEPGETGSVFGTEDFFDYVVVEGSKDGGITWIPVADGYDSRDFSTWLTKWNSSSNNNNSTAAGDPSLFRLRTMDLLNKFNAGDEVVIRFRLFSDPFSAGWGWTIDNLRIQIDETPPVVLHDHYDYVLPTADKMPIIFKIIEAGAIQNAGVIIQVNEQESDTVELPVAPNIDEYTLDVDITGLNAGDVIKYRIIASDTSDNVGAFPADGFINTVVFTPATPQDEYVNNFNSTTTDFIGNFFTIGKPTGFADNAIHSTHFYLNGLGLDQTSSYSYMLKKPIVLDGANPYIRFDEIAIVQGHSSGIDFGTPEFNDYVIVEGSDDDGVTWKPFIDGYDNVGQPSWISSFSNKLDGSPSLFKKRVINLLENGNFQAGDAVLFRFRFYVDADINGWGWAIDNLSIQSIVTGTEESLSDSDFKVYPNPSSSVINIELNVARESDVNLVILNTQGQAILKQSGKFVNGSLRTTVDLTQLHDGLYLIKAEFGGRTVTKKVIKVKN